MFEHWGLIHRPVLQSSFKGIQLPKVMLCIRYKGTLMIGIGFCIGHTETNY